MISLLTKLFQILSNNGISIHLEEAPEGTPFPYAVYKLEPSVKVESHREDFPLFIDIWDNQSDTTRLEGHTETLFKELKDARLLDENQLLIFADGSRGMVPQPDGVRRRQIRYTIKRYER